MAGVNPSNPKLTALLEAGITVDELVAAAADAVAKGKPFAYALASAEGRRRDAATAPLPNVQPDAPVETYAQRAARQRMEEVAPNPAIAPVGDVVMQRAGWQPPAPVGHDPNIPVPAGQIVVDEPGGLPGDTTPTTPDVPTSADIGANAGIETLRQD